MERFPEEQYVNSLIGFGSRFKGDIEIEGLFRVDGDFSGSIKTEGKVLIGTHGRADSTVNARVVVIGGVFRGTIYATDKILILASAVVIGNLYTPRLIAEEGVLMHCSLVITGKSDKRQKMIRTRAGRSGESLQAAEAPASRQLSDPSAESRRGNTADQSSDEPSGSKFIRGFRRRRKDASRSKGSGGGSHGEN